jgi:hypothetical protein
VRFTFSLLFRVLQALSLSICVAKGTELASCFVSSYSETQISTSVAPLRVSSIFDSSVEVARRNVDNYVLRIQAEQQLISIPAPLPGPATIRRCGWSLIGRLDFMLYLLHEMSVTCR